MNSRVVHRMRLTQAKITKKQARPQGNYPHDEHQYGVVEHINAGATPTLDLYLDGAQNFGSTEYLTKGVKYLAFYFPTVGDVVLVQRGKGGLRSSRLVLGKAAGAASPYALPLGGAVQGDGTFIWTQGPNFLWGGPGVPIIPLATRSTPGAANGDWYFRTDVGRIY